jgi:hypothetical protein
MTDIDRILAERYDRRGFMRMAGATTLGAAVLAACKKAEDNGSATGTSGAPASHPPIEQEPGDLAVFDWSGYGNGDYYPNKERASSGNSTRTKPVTPRSSPCSRTTTRRTRRPWPGP